MFWCLGSNLLVTFQASGTIKEEDKSSLVWISEKKKMESILERKVWEKGKPERFKRSRGSWRAEEGPFIQKGSLLLIKEEKKEQKKSSFSPPGRSVKPNQCLAWQCCSSPRHRPTMEASLGRHTSHFQSASSRTSLRVKGLPGGTSMNPEMFLFFFQFKFSENTSVVRLGFTSKKVKIALLS